MLDQSDPFVHTGGGNGSAPSGGIASDDNKIVAHGNSPSR
jgi:hypothetical protein